MEGPYNSRSQDIRQRRRHVDILPNDKVRRMNHNLILLLIPLPPRLLPNHPDTRPHPGPGLGGLLADDELEPGHGAEAALEGLAGLDEVVHGGIVHGLGDDDGVVGRALEEGRLGEVEEDRVGVQAAHLGEGLGGAPLDLVEGGVVWVGHSGCFSDVLKVYCGGDWFSRLYSKNTIKG